MVEDERGIEIYALLVENYGLVVLLERVERILGLLCGRRRLKMMIWILEIWELGLRKEAKKCFIQQEIRFFAHLLLHIVRHSHLLLWLRIHSVLHRLLLLLIHAGLLLHAPPGHLRLCTVLRLLPVRIRSVHHWLLSHGGHGCGWRWRTDWRSTTPLHRGTEKMM